MGYAYVPDPKLLNSGNCCFIPSVLPMVTLAHQLQRNTPQLALRTFDLSEDKFASRLPHHLFARAVWLISEHRLPLHTKWLFFPQDSSHLSGGEQKINSGDLNLASENSYDPLEPNYLGAFLRPCDDATCKLTKYETLSGFDGLLALLVTIKLLNTFNMTLTEAGVEKLSQLILEMPVLSAQLTYQKWDNKKLIDHLSFAVPLMNEIIQKHICDKIIEFIEANQSSGTSFDDLISEFEKFPDFSGWKSFIVTLKSRRVCFLNAAMDELKNELGLLKRPNDSGDEGPAEPRKAQKQKEHASAHATTTVGAITTAGLFAVTQVGVATNDDSDDDHDHNVATVSHQRKRLRTALPLPGT